MYCTEKTKTRILNLARCYLLFGEKKYAEVLELLSNVDTYNHRYFTHKNPLWCKAVYELNKIDAYSIISERSNYFSSSLSKYTSSEKINPHLGNQLANFFKFIKKIAKSHWDRGISKVQLKKQLDYFKDDIFEYTWLKEKIEGLPR